MNGEIPSVPITTLAGIASLTDCKCLLEYLSYAFLYVHKDNQYRLVCLKILFQFTVHCYKFIHTLFASALQKLLCIVFSGLIPYFLPPFFPLDRFCLRNKRRAGVRLLSPSILFPYFSAVSSFSVPE